MAPLKFTVRLPPKPTAINNALTSANPLYTPPDLPDEVILRIISHTDISDIHKLTQISRSFRKLVYSHLSTVVLGRIPYALACHLLNNQHPDESFYETEVDSMGYPRKIYDVKPSEEQVNTAKGREVMTTRKKKMEELATTTNYTKNNVEGVFLRPPPKAPKALREVKNEKEPQEEVYAPYFTLQVFNPMLALDQGFCESLYAFFDKQEKNGGESIHSVRTGNFSIDLLRMERIVTVRDRELMKQMRRTHAKWIECVAKGMVETPEWKAYGAKEVEKVKREEEEERKRLGKAKNLNLNLKKRKLEEIQAEAAKGKGKGKVKKENIKM